MNTFEHQLRREKVPTDTNITFDELAKKSQRFLSECPVVVLGSGATIPHGLPSMSTLADSLLTMLTEADPAGWYAFAKHLEDTKDLEKTLHEVALPLETVEIVVRATWEIVSAKDIEFHGRLLTGATPFPLAEMFRYLLRTADARIQVVTTNYDRLVEYAANQIDSYASTGVTAGLIQRFVPTSVCSERPPAPGFEGIIDVLKVHGSLDWFRDSIDEVVGIPLAHAIPAGMQPLMVTPGVSKYREVHKDPFRTVMSAADTVLRKASCFVCVGYGFNDEHVQPVLVKRVMRDDIPLLIVTRTLTQQTRDAFLVKPPKRFLFLEAAPGGTRVYEPGHPDGTMLDGLYVWQLHDFMQMVTAQGGGV